MHGMQSCAVWNARRDELLSPLARDPVELCIKKTALIQLTETQRVHSKL